MWACWTSCRYVGTPEAASSRNSIGDPDLRCPSGGVFPPPPPPGEEVASVAAGPLTPLSIVIGQDYRDRLSCQGAQRPAGFGRLRLKHGHRARARAGGAV